MVACETVSEDQSAIEIEELINHYSLRMESETLLYEKYCEAGREGCENCQEAVYTS